MQKIESNFYEKKKTAREIKVLFPLNFFENRIDQVNNLDVDLFFDIVNLSECLYVCKLIYSY